MTFADGDIEVVTTSVSRDVPAPSASLGAQQQLATKTCSVLTQRTYRTFGINWAAMRTTVGYKSDTVKGTVTRINFADTWKRNFVWTFNVSAESTSSWISSKKAWARTVWTGSLVFKGSPVAVSKIQGLAGDARCRKTYESWYS